MKTIVMVLGVVVLLVGVIGYFNNPVLSLFPVNGLHNLVHLAIGVLLIIFAMRGDAGASMIAKVMGIVFALVAILGFLAPDLMADLLAIDMADNWLHVVLAIVFLWIGFGMKPKTMAM